MKGEKKISIIWIDPPVLRENFKGVRDLIMP